MPKILTIGPPRGRIAELVAKVGAIEKKHGPFEALFVLGPLFSEAGEKADEESKLKNGELVLPIPTYFYGSKVDVGAIKNLTYLGKSGVHVTKEGLRVAFCGGRWDAAQWMSDSAEHITQTDVQTLLDLPEFALPKPIPKAVQGETLAAAKAAASAQAQAEEIAASNAALMASRPPIDLLLTDYWPSSVTLFSNKLPHDSARVWGCQPVATLVKAAAPRYHFALSPSDEVVGLDATTRETGVFWEREPYLNDLATNAGWAGKKQQSVTRFISLANFANANKARWFMALNLVPGAAPPKPSNTTPSPYFVAEKRTRDRAEEEEDGPNFRWSEKRQKTDGPPPEGYKCKICGSTEHYIRLCPERSTHSLPPKPRREKALPVGPEDCWFCLSNPKCAKHLLVDIGEECYLALPRGQLPPSEDEANPVPGGGHVLIIPMAHYGCLFDLDAAGKAAVRAETAKYRQALRSVYAQFDCVPVAWEMGRSSGTRVGHTQMQVLPVPKHLADQLAPAFQEAAQFEFDDDKDEIQAFFDGVQGEDYFWMDLNGEERLCRLASGERFNMQFARYMLAGLLGVPDRADWKACALSVEEEKVETASFRQVYEKYSNT